MTLGGRDIAPRCPRPEGTELVHQAEAFASSFRAVGAETAQRAVPINYASMA
jgi:hypothetical protein